MITALQIFTKALETATGHSYVSSVTYTPLRMPAYKEFHFVLKQFDGKENERKVYQMSYRERVTNNEEKEYAMQVLTEKFISYVLQDIIKNS